MLVKDYAVEAGDTFEIKDKKDTREVRVDDPEYYDQEMRRIHERENQIQRMFHEFSRRFIDEERERIEELRERQSSSRDRNNYGSGRGDWRRNLPPGVYDIGEFGTHIDSPGRELLVN